MKLIKVAAVSFVSQFGRPEENLHRILNFVERAAEQEAHLVCFPEVCVQGYYTDPQLMRDQAEPVDGPTCQQLTKAAKNSNIIICAGMALKDSGKVFNSQVYIGINGLIGFSSKIHLCKGEESLIFDAGNSWPVFDLGLAKVGTLICNDSLFPESARCLALAGAEVIIISFATGRCDSAGRPSDPLLWPDFVQRWAPSRAFDNRVFVVGVNHAGDVADSKGIAGASWVEPGSLHRWPGYSFMIGPNGGIIAESARDHNDERMLIADLDPAEFARWRVGGGDYIHCRRPEVYAQLVK